LTLSPTFSVCPSHGYLNGRQEKCTVCNEDTEVYSRVVGYLRPIKQWNNGKRAEFEMRKTFTASLEEKELTRRTECVGAGRELPVAAS
ncbi:MAG: ribonucleoside triphosphate reductase, partial [Deltaproteobacteria bacterium]|nr:ribonucleoside triphosphate reductase [Deltaproteobacteria bacterium]